MATFSMPFTDTTDPGPQIGDGRPYTAAEWRLFWWLFFAQGTAGAGVARDIWNECAVTVTGANALQVDTGVAMARGSLAFMDTTTALAPTSAPGGQTRKDSVIVQMDLDNSGVGQNKTRVTTKSGTAGAYPSMTQNAATVWECELYRYTIDDAGAITGLTDVRVFFPANDHGDLSGLADDDHTQYYNAARLTKAVIDALNVDADTVDGYHASDLISGVALGFQGVTVLWGGAIGGSDGHRPVTGGGANEDWHLANGELVGGVQTLDSRNRVPIGAGDTYAVNASGGALTVDSSHTHGSGTLAAASHTHAGGTLSTNNAGAHYHMVNTVTTVIDTTHTHPASSVASALLEHSSTAGGDNIISRNHTHAISISATVASHSHNVDTATGGVSAQHTHTVSSGVSGSATPAVAGSTATGGSVALAILPPYRAWYFITYIG